jgi:hypothetical protein
MSGFPSLTIEGVTIPRVLCGTNSLLGFSHVSRGRDAWIREHFTPQRIARVFAKCMELGVNAAMGPLFPRLLDALEETEKLTGVRMTWVATTSHELAPKGREEELRKAVEAHRGDEAMAIVRESIVEQVARIKAAGASICIFHGGWIDGWPMQDGSMIGFERHTRLIREAGMIPGAVSHLSARLAEVDRGNHDVAVLVTPVNKGGWNMRPSRDEAAETIGKIKKPVIAIKSLACGRYEAEHVVEDWLKWVVDVKGVEAIALGLMLEQEAEQSLPFLREQFAAKFGA